MAKPRSRALASGGDFLPGWLVGGAPGARRRGGIHWWGLALPSVILLLLLAGCTKAFKAAEPTQRNGEARVLLMPVEIELAELTAGGLVEPRADWTRAARAHISQVLDEELGRRQALMIPYTPPLGQAAREHHHQQLIKLHRAVAAAILQHKFDPELRLPTKDNLFDWTLGEGAADLAQDIGADYALFLYIQDTYASQERQLISLALSVLYLFPMQPGSLQVGFASLVDLRDGRIVWFNRLASLSGDLRSLPAARVAVEGLLHELPL